MKNRLSAQAIPIVLFTVCIPWLAFGQFGGGMGGSRMGGMSGGMGMPGGGGGMEGMSEPPEILTYQRPAGPPPGWLTNGIVAVKSTESLREKLNGQIQIESEQSALSDSVKYLRDQFKIDIEFDFKNLEGDAIDPSACKGFPAGGGPARELLMRVLSPHGLTYRVLENHVQITTREQARRTPTIRYYDLSFVQADSKLLTSILSAIEQSIEPEEWQNNGGNGSMIPLGQLLVVRTLESSHLEIEKLLSRLSQTVSPNHGESQPSQPTPPAGAPASKP